MRPRKIIAMVMTFLMMLSLLPSLVFAAAAPEGELGGQLKIKGTAAVGSELSADYEKVTPEGLTDDYVTFSWSRKVGDQLTEVGTEKTYKLVDEDLGNKIELKITGKAEMGITGELKVNTVEIVATPEEAPEETPRVDSFDEWLVGEVENVILSKHSEGLKGVDILKTAPKRYVIRPLSRFWEEKLTSNGILQDVWESFLTVGGDVSVEMMSSNALPLKYETLRKVSNG